MILETFNHLNIGQLSNEYEVKVLYTQFLALTEINHHLLHPKPTPIRERLALLWRVTMERIVRVTVVAKPADQEVIPPVGPTSVKVPAGPTSEKG